MFNEAGWDTRQARGSSSAQRFGNVPLNDLRGLWQSRVMLVVLGGLPGTGKTTIAGSLAERLAAAHVRIDAIETAMWRAGISGDQPTGVASYVVAEAVAETCLRNGTRVIIDAVNPVEATREAWRALARRANTQLRVVEVVCSDRVEHQRRIERRGADLEAAKMPTWADVTTREYEQWHDPRLVVDTRQPLAECLARIEEYLSS